MNPSPMIPPNTRSPPPTTPHIPIRSPVRTNENNSAPFRYEQPQLQAPQPSSSPSPSPSPLSSSYSPAAITSPRPIRAASRPSRSPSYSTHTYPILSPRARTTHIEIGGRNPSTTTSVAASSSSSTSSSSSSSHHQQQQQQNYHAHASVQRVRPTAITAHYNGRRMGGASSNLAAQRTSAAAAAASRQHLASERMASEMLQHVGDAYGLNHPAAFTSSSGSMPTNAIAHYSQHPERTSGSTRSSPSLPPLNSRSRPSSSNTTSPQPVVMCDMACQTDPVIILEALPPSVNIPTTSTTTVSMTTMPNSLSPVSLMLSPILSPSLPEASPTSASVQASSSLAALQSLAMTRRNDYDMVHSRLLQIHSPAIYSTLAAKKDDSEIMKSDDIEEEADGFAVVAPPPKVFTPSPSGVVVASSPITPSSSPTLTTSSSSSAIGTSSSSTTSSASSTAPSSATVSSPHHKHTLSATSTLPLISPFPGMEPTPLESSLSTFYEQLTSWTDFDIFELADITGGWPLSFLFLMCDRKHNFLQPNNIDLSTAFHFIQEVESNYLPNPYHTSTHAADVLHAAFHLVEHTPVLQSTFSPYDIFLLYVSAAVHDFSHPGVNNSFLCNSKAPLALRYNDRSVLESHHISGAFRMMVYKPETNILQGFSTETYNKIRKALIDLVLSTDLAVHFELMSGFKRKLQANQLDISGSEEDRLSIMQVILKCGDLSHPARSRKLHLRWSELVTEEFFLQGDREKLMNLPPSTYMNRDDCNLADSQIGFITYLVKPMFQSYTTFSHISYWLEKVDANLEWWQDIAKSDADEKVRAAATAAANASSEEPETGESSTTEETTSAGFYHSTTSEPNSARSTTTSAGSSHTQSRRTSVDVTPGVPSSISPAHKIPLLVSSSSNVTAESSALSSPVSAATPTITTPISASTPASATAPSGATPTHAPLMSKLPAPMLVTSQDQDTENESEATDRMMSPRALLRSTRHSSSNPSLLPTTSTVLLSSVSAIQPSSSPNSHHTISKRRSGTSSAHHHRKSRIARRAGVAAAMTAENLAMLAEHAQAAALAAAGASATEAKEQRQEEEQQQKVETAAAASGTTGSTYLRSKRATLMKGVVPPTPVLRFDVPHSKERVMSVETSSSASMSSSVSAPSSASSASHPRQQQRSTSLLLSPTSSPASSAGSLITSSASSHHVSPAKGMLDRSMSDSSSTTAAVSYLEVRELSSLTSIDLDSGLAQYHQLAPHHHHSQGGSGGASNIHPAFSAKAHEMLLAAPRKSLTSSTAPSTTTTATTIAPTPVTSTPQPNVSSPSKPN